MVDTSSEIELDEIFASSHIFNKDFYKNIFEKIKDKYVLYKFKKQPEGKLNVFAIGREEKISFDTYNCALSITIDPEYEGFKVKLIEPHCVIKDNQHSFFIAKNYKQQIMIVQEDNLRMIINGKTMLIEKLSQSRLIYYTLLDIMFSVFQERNKGNLLAQKDLTKEDMASLPLSIELPKDIRTKQDLCTFLFGAQKHNMNKIGLATAISFCHYKYLLEANDQDRIYAFLLNYKSDFHYDEYVSIKNPATKRMNKIIVPRIIEEYFLANNDKASIVQIKDSIRMAKDLGEKISLGGYSCSFIDRMHDALCEKMLILQLKKEKQYKKGEDNIALKNKRVFKERAIIGSLRLIKDKLELSREGKVQENCVFSYRKKIDQGRCSIYTGLIQGKRYTIEVTANKDKISIIQVKGKRNKNPNEDIKSYILEEFKKAFDGGYKVTMELRS